MPGFKYQPRSEEDWEKRANQRGGGFQSYISDDYRTYTLKKGENAIRILPPTWDGARHYGLDVFVHFGVGPDKASVVCPYRTAEPPCPICEARARAARQNDEELVKELRSTQRVLVWLIDRKDEDKGPVLWGMPWTLDKEISKVSKDRTTGKFYSVDNPEEGYDIYFDRDGEGMLTKYTGVQLARRATSVDQDHVDYVAEHPLPETLLVRDYEEIKALFEGASPPAEEEAPAPRPLARGNGADHVSDRPPPAERPTRGNRPQLEPNRRGTRLGPRFSSITREPGESTATGDPPPGDEPPPPEEEDADAPRRPAPTAPAREPAPAQAAPPPSGTASKAASLRERFARK